MPGAATVDFYLGLGSRYSYLAASQVERIEKTHGCRFVWKPIAGQYDWGYREYDAKCWASYYGIPFREPVAFRTDPAMLALACLAAEMQGALVPCCHLLQRLIFVEGVATFFLGDRMFWGNDRLVLLEAALAA